MPDSIIPTKSKRGFASMDPAKRAAIARLGGRAAQHSGNARRWNSESGRAAALARNKKAAT